MLKQIIIYLSIITQILFSPQYTEAKPNSILYIPLDNRPISLSYIQKTAEFYGVTLVTPPLELIASHDHPGNPDKLMQWLIKNANTADKALVATDSLIYGGLVASRTHYYTSEQLLKRAKALNTIKQINPSLKIYAYSTIMRTPRHSLEPFEPYYYEQYGGFIFRLTQLLDKEDLQGGKLNKLDSIEKNNMISLVPEDYLHDWFSRRKKNLVIHYYLLENYANNSFYFYTIGKDDSAELSQTHMETRHINKNLPANTPSDFHVLPGVDQLAMLLLARATSEEYAIKPRIYIDYADTVGSATISLYSDQPIYSSVLAQTEAVGAELAINRKDADFTLAVYTPEKGFSRESIDKYNSTFPSLHSQKFAEHLRKLTIEKHKIALADVAFVNGATNGLMKTLDTYNVLDKLLAYSGWNTVDNAIGYTLAQAIMSLKMTNAQREFLLKTRLLDDWLYQSNVRFDTIDSYVGQDRNKQYHLGSDTPKYEKIITRAMNDEVLKTYYLSTTNFSIKLPWKRMFDAEIIIH